MNLTLPQRLRAARRSAGYKSAKAFITAHGIPGSTYSQHETGARNIDANTLKEYAKLFDVNYKWLAGGEGSVKKNKSDETRAKAFATELLDLNTVIKTAPLISEKLLSAVLEGLVKTSKKINAKTLANAATSIYSDVVRLEGDLNDQLKAVTPAVNAFLRFSK